MFGAGGERDAGKRPQMAAVAESLADRVIVTDDNPRCEDGDAIVADILAGMDDRGRAEVMRDRSASHHRGNPWCRASADVVLVAGKGHETTQEDAQRQASVQRSRCRGASAAGEGVMLNMRLSEVALWTQGRLHGEDGVITGVGIDSRHLSDGDLFVALPGSRSDGHDHLADAASHGAARRAGFTPRRFSAAADRGRQYANGAGRSGQRVRARRNARVIGITGSNGKTTVKTLIASILSRHARTHVNAGNRNNEIGLPLSVLAMPVNCEYAVFEMGAGKPGDIEYLAAIARPHVGLVNNVGAGASGAHEDSSKASPRPRARCTAPCPPTATP